MTEEKVADRIRALIAKAESSTFTHEAEAFLAKAQELMARHAIDEAMIRDANTADQIITTTIKCEAPYASAKADLVYSIAKANRCEGVWSARTKTMTIIGFSSDLGSVETLYNALLLYATREMLTADKRPSESTKSFRNSFLVFYAERIGVRMKAAYRVAVDEYEAETGSSTALVLADQSAMVQASVKEMFPRLRMGARTVQTNSGAVAGTRAANSADLGQKGIR